MSKLIKITAAVAILIGVSVGCSKFLDLDPPYTQDAENFFNNEDEYLRALLELMIACWNFCFLLDRRHCIR